ncbi:hypothetical protein ACIOGZ_29415 [Kitasatospora sp. NPDC088160]|uniref:hypothetical protein n=1 Tax=Kitasatospora sp. NPDC088160 TaxID=3364072 RepID=UPI00382C4A3C
MKDFLMPLLPPIGAEIPCSSLALSTPMQIGTDLLTVDFRGGLKTRVDVNPDDPINSVRLRLVGLRFTAEIPEVAGGGTLTIEQNDVDEEARGLLTVTQQLPPLYDCSFALGTCTLTIERPKSNRLVLVPKEKRAWALTSKRLTQYPPRGDMFDLKAPVEFVDPAKPDDIAAVLQKFSAKIGGL